MVEKFDLGTLPGSLLELLFKGLSVGRSHQLRELWIACYSSALWFIWQTRNKCRFNGIVPSDLHACRMISGYVNASSRIASGSTFNTSHELCIVKRFGASCHPRRAPCIIDINWHPPLLGWIKINTDGAWKTNSPRAGYI